jgi:hypothetical protein
MSGSVAVDVLPPEPFPSTSNHDDGGEVMVNEGNGQRRFGSDAFVFFLTFHNIVYFSFLLDLRNGSAFNSRSKGWGLHLASQLLRFNVS